MEKGGKKWSLGPNPAVTNAATFSIRRVVHELIDQADQNGSKPMVMLGHGDPSSCPCYRTSPIAEDTIESAVRSGEFNGYAPNVGIYSARCAIAEYLNKDLPYKLSPDDVYVTSGCTQAIEIMLSVLGRPGANILLPKPGFPFYEARGTFSKLEVKHFNLIPERGWEVDLDNVEALADENTVAMVIINPGNPCGNVFTYQHLSKIVESIESFLNISTDPATFIQGAVPRILGNTRDDFFTKIVDMLRQTSNICYEKLKEIDCITCPHKPEGSMFVMVKLNLLFLEGITDCVDFCCKLAKEESVIVLPVTVHTAPHILMVDLLSVH